MSKEIILCKSCDEEIKPNHKLIHSNETSLRGFYHSFCYYAIKGEKHET